MPNGVDERSVLAMKVIAQQANSPQYRLKSYMGETLSHPKYEGVYWAVPHALAKRARVSIILVCRSTVASGMMMAYG